jgi:TrmH RNA methyltransferase
LKKEEKHGANRKIPKPRKKIEMKICGVHACKAVFLKRPQDIIRVYVTEENIKDFNKILKFCAEKKLAYRVLNSQEMEKVSESNHHEGVCFLIKKQPVANVADYLSQTQQNKADCVVALENVQNPHNLGAIIRVCASFGAQAILVSHTDPALSGAAFRIAEGGAEFIKLIATENLEKSVLDFKAKGYTAITTSSHNGKSLFEEKMPAKTLVIFGSESQGISPALFKTGDKTLKIPSTGHVESLNIACATSVILAEYWRNHKR